MYLCFVMTFSMFVLCWKRLDHSLSTKATKIGIESGFDEEKIQGGRYVAIREIHFQNINQCKRINKKFCQFAERQRLVGDHLLWLREKVTIIFVYNSIADALMLWSCE